jgi:hypothetical protein
MKGNFAAEAFQRMRVSATDDGRVLDVNQGFVSAASLDLNGSSLE